MFERTINLACIAVAASLVACGGDASPSDVVDIGDGSSAVDVSADGSAAPVSPFTPCSESAECRGGEICRDFECREFCTEDADCDGAASVCDAAAGVCVFCLERADCEPGNLCRDQQCAPGCLADADCGEGQVCEPTAQQCQSGECTVDADCPGGTRCSGARCVEIERCTVGESRCEEGVRSTCFSGIGFDVDPCGEGLACAEVDGAVACVNERCAEEPSGCISSSRTYRCSDDLSSLTVESCEDGLICVRGSCAAQACEAGESRCEDESTIAVCSPDGTDETLEPCAGETVCRNGACIEPPPAACLTISPGFVDFGAVSVSSTAFRTVTLQSCGTEAVEVSDLLLGDEDGAFSITDGTRFPIAVAAGGERTVPIAFLPDDIGEFSTTLAAVTLDGVQPNPPIRIVGEGIDTACAGRAVECARSGTEDYSQSLLVDPGERVRCRAVGFDDATDGRFGVTRDGEPYTNIGQSGTSATVTFIGEQGPERGDEYRVCYSSEVAECGRLCSVVSLRNPIDASRYLTVELVWSSERETPENASGNDLDLHVALNGGCWESTDTDVHFRSTTIDWGTPGASDDVSLVRDDSNGNGPEIARIATQADYEVVLGVHLWTDAGWGENSFRLRVYHFGEEIADYEGSIVDEKSIVEVGTLRLGANPRFIERGDTYREIVQAPCPIVAD